MTDSDPIEELRTRLEAVEQDARDRIAELQRRLDSREAAAPSTFTREQLRDSKFYQEHEAEILGAVREGRITNVRGVEFGPAARAALWEQMKEGKL